MRITVCQDCCCGTVKKHPTTNHFSHLRRLREAAAKAGGTVRISQCLDTCETSNVVVVQASGHKPVWFGWVLHDDAIADLERWLAAGGPGSPVPDTLELHRITPPGLRAATDGAE
ncbi:(2Fe-2S) ferredoxin domain-containing protein [Actinokineospora bangkokensis]|uniref:(2Fe-2S) ferredoxin domain-containing protein n=1 Tax=Actinokineospora bangkokensis TaxID=1193682 RepID=UPI001E4C8AA2|nr:(2Fe-2S) ferredoxin domain-containing protein [Actinokineospora bangkokensis]